MSNPILPGFNPDPTICRVGKDYFVATSTFEYFPGVPIYHSTDLINWRLIGHALNRRSQLDMRCIEPGCGVWAPTLRYWKGRFYLATCCVYSRTQRPIQPDGFFVSTDNIWDQNAWTEPIYFEQVGIDQDLFFDDDDRVYLCTARFTVSPIQGRGTKLVTYCCEIDIKTGRSITPPVLLRQSEVIPGQGSVAEGPHIYKKDGYYYLATAEGGTGPRHHVIVTRSDKPFGPYHPHPDGVCALNPVPTDEPGVQRTGHADLVCAEDGKWWAVMLGIRRQQGGTFQLGRETFLAPVEWSSDGWPLINAGQRITEVIPKGLPSKTSTLEWSDSFESDTLSPGWYHLRTPLRPCHSLTDRPGALTLFGNSQTIEMFNSPAMLLRKQPFYRGTWTTEIDFEPTSAYEEAGTTVFYSGESYAAIVVGKENDQQRRLTLRYTDPSLRKVQEIVQSIPAAGPVTLQISAECDWYSFRYKLAASPNFELLGRLTSKVLDGGSDMEFEFYFTGAHFGLFAQATKGEPNQTPAHFSYAKLSEEVEA